MKLSYSAVSFPLEPSFKTQCKAQLLGVMRWDVFDQVNYVLTFVFSSLRRLEEGLLGVIYCYY